MAKGDGGLSEIRRGVWRVTLSFGKDPITGKRERVTKTVHGSKADARKVRDQIRRDHEAGLRLDADKITFGEFAKQWFDSRVEASAVEKSRTERERSILKTLNRYLANVRICEITPQAVQTLYSEIRKDKESELGKRYSGTSLRMIHVVFKQILQQAVNFDLILRNPCDRVTAPKADDPERRSLSAEDAAKLLSCVDEAETSAYETMQEKERRQFDRGNGFGRSYLRGLNHVSNALAVRIGLATGMRRGEVFGLSWGCVDLERGVLSVRRSLTSYGDLKAPKTRAGIRNIAVDASTVAHLAKWKAAQASELLKLGIRQEDETPVCCSEKGGFADLHNFERWWRRFRSESGFQTLKFHELRHTQATQLLANGVDVKTVQTRLGHSNASLTLNWYAHAMPENDEKAAELMGALLSAKPKETPVLKVKTA